MVGYSRLKFSDLKNIVKGRGLLICGDKADLIARLQRDDKPEAADDRDSIERALLAQAGNFEV